MRAKVLAQWRTLKIRRNRVEVVDQNPECNPTGTIFLNRLTYTFAQPLRIGTITHCLILPELTVTTRPVAVSVITVT